MALIRVFARRTSFTPDDEMSFFDVPPMFDLPEHDAVHIVVVFTWDIERGKFLQENWAQKTDKPVLIGGPAFDDPCTGEFIPGRYVKEGITFTSRGCPNKCKFCFVPKREGEIHEIKNFAQGNVIQDNNFLACSKEHRQRVYEMLKLQRQISFRGGLESSRLTDWDIKQMQGLKIADLWLACDNKSRIKSFEETCGRLHKAGFSQNKIRCYVLIGDDMQENESRLRRVYGAGALPFAQLFQPPERIEYSSEWKNFARDWSRPAIYKKILKGAVM